MGSLATITSSAARLRGFQVKYSVNQRKIGLTKSLNLAINFASGELLFRLDADDVCINKRVETQTKYMNTSPSVGVCFTAVKLIEGGKVSDFLIRTYSVHESIRERLIKGNFLVHSSACLRRQVVISSNGYKQFLRKKQDYEYWFRLLDSSFKFSVLNAPLVAAERRRSQRLD